MSCCRLIWVDMSYVWAHGTTVCWLFESQVQTHTVYSCTTQVLHLSLQLHHSWYEWHEDTSITSHQDVLLVMYSSFDRFLGAIFQGKCALDLESEHVSRCWLNWHTPPVETHLLYQYFTKFAMKTPCKIPELRLSKYNHNLFSRPTTWVDNRLMSSADSWLDWESTERLSDSILASSCLAVMLKQSAQAPHGRLSCGSWCGWFLECWGPLATAVCDGRAQAFGNMQLIMSEFPHITKTSYHRSPACYLGGHKFLC